MEERKDASFEFAIKLTCHRGEAARKDNVIDYDDEGDYVGC